MFTISETDDVKVWFTSDLHLGHQREFVWEARGYTSYQHHTDGVIDTINQYVKENDILFNLGDLCLNSDLSGFENYLNKIVCKNMYYIHGNHESPHYNNIYCSEIKKLLLPDSSINSVYPVRYKNIVYIGHYSEIYVNKQFIVLCHYPFMSWNKLNHGAWMLCGHEHGSLHATRPENTNGKILDVGWDLHKKPLNFKKVQDIMNKKHTVSVGHHNVS